MAISSLFNIMALQSFVQYANAPMIMTLGIVLIVCIVIMIVVLKGSNKRQDEKVFAKQLESMVSQEDNYVLQQKVGTQQKWSAYWADLLKKSDMIKKNIPVENVGIAMFGITISVVILVIIFTQNIVLGILAALLLLFAVKTIATSKIAKKKEILEDQIPGFIETLRSNVQGNMLPEQALIEAINQTKDPLYSELEIAKLVSTTSSFSLALTRLRHETSSADLRFLCSCIELSSRLGANLEEQLEIIEKMLIENKEIKVLLNSAIREHQPLKLMSFILIPGLFLFTYLTNEATRAFWFKTTASYVVFGLIVLIFGLGQFIASRFIKQLDDLR